LVERFDRNADGTKIHFEEFNQLLGRPAEAKYEGSYGEMAAFISANQSQQREQDIDRLFRRVLTCILLGNNDAHSKNFALLYTREGFRLAPFYDIVAATLYPRFQNSGMALRMAAGTNPRTLSDIGPKHLLLLAHTFNLNEVTLEVAVNALRRRLPAAEKADCTIEETMERNIRLNWEEIVREARQRRRERGLTQQHLAALAKVGRSTLLRFENQKGDVTLSSVLRILGVLDMLDRKQEGSLLLRRSENGFVVMFAPVFG